jgi:type I restriction enzyme, S subunit
MKWPLVKLTECCEIVAGSTPSRFSSEFWGGTIPWVTPKDLSELTSPYIFDTPEKITELGYKSCSTVLLPKGSVLLSSRAPIGYLAINAIDMCTNQGFKSLIPGDKVNSLYLYYCLGWRKDYLISLGTGSTFKEISKSVLSRVEIPLPPLEEQQRIAAVLDKADRLRQLDRQLVAHYDRLTQSVFLEKGWEKTKLSFCLDNIVAGWSIGGEQTLLKDGELGVLKISAVTSGNFLSKEYKAVSKNLITKPIIHPMKGDLLFSRANTRELVGAVCIVDNDYPYLFLPDKIWKINLQRNKANNYFIKFLLSHKEFRTELTKTATGTSGSMLNISKEKLQNLCIPLPPVKLQNQFASIIENIERQKVKAEESLQQSEALFQALLQRAFKGELFENTAVLKEELSA